MKKIKKIVMGLLVLITFSAKAQDGIYTTSQPVPVTSSSDAAQDSGFFGEGNDSLRKLVKYLLNLGAYLGFNVDVAPGSDYSTQLTNSNFAQLAQSYVINTFFGAVPVNTSASTTSAATGTSYPYFVPSADSLIDDYKLLTTLNSYANTTFTNSPYNVDSSKSGQVSINPLIDQTPFQSDPVSQSLLNILSTPDSSYCMVPDDADDTKSCPLTQGKVVTNVMGDALPQPINLTNDKNSILAIIPQLNGDSLLAPLMYDTTTTSINSGTGLTAQSEAQLAANFIRYATSSVTPLDLPTIKEYNDLYIKATTGKSRAAREKIANYLTSLHSFAAQMSVVYSNMYYMLSKRLPQKASTGSDKPTSQAMNEFVMATWRLQSTSSTDKNSQWLQKINTGSPATVQKEIAILLAEINYQLYLNRQQDERLLLTNSIALAKSNRATPPNADLSEAAN